METIEFTGVRPSKTCSNCAANDTCWIRQNLTSPPYRCVSWRAFKTSNDNVITFTKEARDGR